MHRRFLRLAAHIRPFSSRLLSSRAGFNPDYVAQKVNQLTGSLASRHPSPDLHNADDHDNLARSAIDVLNTVASPRHGSAATYKRQMPQKLIARRAPSNDAVQFHQNSYETFEQDYTTHIEIKKGTFIESRRNNISNHGIVLGEKYSNQRWRVIVLTSSGEIYRPTAENIMFSIPAAVDTKLVARCGIDHIATSDFQIAARVEVLKRIREIEIAVEDILYSVGKAGHGLYDRVRSTDPNEWSDLTLAEATRALTPDTSILSFFAAHKLLFGRPEHFLADPAYQVTGKMHVRPKNHVNLIENVTNMIRARDPRLEAFALKCRPIIVANQERAHRTWHQPPSITATSNSVWNATEKSILQFLLNSLRVTRSTQDNPYAFGVFHLVKMLYPESKDVHLDLVHPLLVDLAVFAPWQDVGCLQADLDQSLPDNSPRVHEANRIVADGLAARAANKGKSILGPQDFYPTDPAESIRHDWGQIEVYVVDDPSAQELDDGFSVESIPSEPNNHWVHIHIADPASLIPPNHVFAQEAERMVETQYFIHRTWPMLPASLMSIMSLGSASAGEAQRVLTFSGKIDENGDIIDYQVRAGLVRKVNILHYDSVDSAMGFPSQSRTFTFGDPPAAQAEPPLELVSNQRQDFALLDAISQRLIQNRLRRGVFNCISDKAMPSFNEPLPTTPIDLSVTSTYNGYPAINYELLDGSDANKGSRSIVAEMMKVACRVGSRFFRDQNVPAIRRHSKAIGTDTDREAHELLSLRDQYGTIPAEAHLQYVTIMYPPEYTTELREHWGLGVPEGEGYCRVTSPLRRHADLVLHWQLHSALLHPEQPKFSQDWMETYAREATMLSKQNSNISSVHKRFWSLTALERWLKTPSEETIAFTDNLCVIPSTAQSMNAQINTLQCMCVCPSLGLTGVLEATEKELFPRGSTVPAKIKEIRMGVNPFVVFIPR